MCIRDRKYSDIKVGMVKEITHLITQDDINNSNAKNIYDFLTQNTSLSLAPSSGNKFSQKISMRGYGLTVGSHNLIVNLNGKRLNNIDTSGPDINSIIFEAPGFIKSSAL